MIRTPKKAPLDMLTSKMGCPYLSNLHYTNDSTSQDDYV